MTFHFLKCALKMYIKKDSIESTLYWKLFKIAIEEKMLTFFPHFTRKMYSQIPGQKGLFSTSRYEDPFSPISVLSVSLRYLYFRDVVFVSL